MRGLRSVVLAVALLAVGSAGCGSGSGGGGDGDPSRAVEGVELVVSADLSVSASGVTGTVEVRNDGDEVWVFSGLGVRAGGGTRYDPTGYALLDAGDGVMEVAQRAVPPPDDVDLAALVPFAVRRLATGATTTTDLDIALPPTATGPYAAEGQGPPDEPDRLVVCVGAVPADGDVQPRTGDGVPEEVEGLATHGPPWTDAQAVACSEPISL